MSASAARVGSTSVKGNSGLPDAGHESRSTIRVVVVNRFGGIGVLPAASSRRHHRLIRAVRNSECAACTGSHALRDRQP